MKGLHFYELFGGITRNNLAFLDQMMHMMGAVFLLKFVCRNAPNNVAHFKIIHNQTSSINTVKSGYTLCVYL